MVKASALHRRLLTHGDLCISGGAWRVFEPHSVREVTSNYNLPGACDWAPASPATNTSRFSGATTIGTSHHGETPPGWSPFSRSILNGIAPDIFFPTLAIFTKRCREPDLDAGLDEESLVVVHLRDFLWVG
jgi:hypothetical protein